MTIEVGSTIKGTVVKIAAYGVIVRLAGGKSGLIHISEIADTYVRNVRDYFSENDEVRVKVVRQNSKGRYELSVKQCEVKPEPKTERRALEPAGRSAAAVRSQVAQAPPPPARPQTFEDRLSRFLKDSEERQLDLKRNIESKRGRR